MPVSQRNRERPEREQRSAATALERTDGEKPCELVRLFDGKNALRQEFLNRFSRFGSPPGRLMIKWNAFTSILLRGPALSRLSGNLTIAGWSSAGKRDGIGVSDHPASHVIFNIFTILLAHGKESQEGLMKEVIGQAPRRRIRGLCGLRGPCRV